MSRPYEVLYQSEPMGLFYDQAGTFGSEEAALKRAADWREGRWPLAMDDAGNMTSFPAIPLRGPVIVRGPGLRRRWRLKGGEWIEGDDDEPRIDTPKETTT